MEGVQLLGKGDVIRVQKYSDAGANVFIPHKVMTSSGLLSENGECGFFIFATRLVLFRYRSEGKADCEVEENLRMEDMRKMTKKKGDPKSITLVFERNGNGEEKVVLNAIIDDVQSLVECITKVMSSL